MISGGWELLSNGIRRWPYRKVRGRTGFKRRLRFAFVESLHERHFIHISPLGTIHDFEGFI